MPRPIPAHLITSEQKSALDWLNQQVALGKLSRPAIEDAVGLSQSNLWMILSGRRVIASRGVKALVAYADKLRGKRPKPPDPDPFEQLRKVALNVSPKDRAALTQIVSGLLQVYSSSRRRR